MGYSVFRPLGVTHCVPRRAYPGFTLVCPINGDAAYLVDLRGRVVHRWRLPRPAFYAYLLDNGHLLASLKVPRPTLTYGGFHGLVAELDWDGAIVWQYEDPALHHDHCRLPNGNTLLLRWAPVPPEIHRAVQGGVPGAARNPASAAARNRSRSHSGREARAGTEAEGGVMWGDEVLEVTPTGAVVWQWRSYEVLDPREDSICPLEYRHEWTHCNAVEAVSDDGIAVSFRYINTVGIVDRATGRFRWKWGRGEVYHQHDPTELENGHILIFDNGIHRIGSADRSRVVEVDPRTGRIVWQYVARPESALYSRNISGAQRLPNGNTLICEGDCGRLLEVTAEGEIVWEYHNPFFADDPTWGPVNRLFRAHRYGPDHPALAGRQPDPARWQWLNHAYGLA
jgi:outer membrane protein assembly factor BamB